VARDESVIGTVGVLIVATRGAAGPGEVRVRIRGGSESFLAWSATPLPKGTTVLVIDCPGPRTVNVMPWDDTLGEAPATPGLNEVPHSGE
jgi:membrane protein implicated in regulation of membrane protease activity